MYNVIDIVMIDLSFYIIQERLKIMCNTISLGILQYYTNGIIFNALFLIEKQVNVVTLLITGMVLPITLGMWIRYYSLSF